MYDEHYGLSGRPFQLTPDPRFWFDTATHRKAMAYLGYGLSQGEGFIVISGDVGAGKTTLVGHLVDTIDAARLNVIRLVSTQIAAEDLLRTVCAGLSVDAAGLPKAQMLAAIERGLHAVARTGRRTLLIVDEAQALPTDSLEELRMLSNFQSGGHALLQIVLLGQPEFRDHLAHASLEQLRQRVIAMHHLGPMEPEELEPYIVHRLRVVGWDGRPRFRTDALAAIYAWSGGIPRRVNQLVSRVLLHGAIEDIDSFAAADVAAVADDMSADGMVGNAMPPVEPEFDLDDVAAARPIAIEVEHAEQSAVMEWPFSPDPAPEAVEDAARPILLEPPVSIDESAETEAEPVTVSVQPQLAPVAEARSSLFSAFRRLRPAQSDDAPQAEAAETEAQAAVEQPAPEPEPAPVADLEIARRLAAIEARLEDQDVALRRVLTLLVDWVEGGGQRPDLAELRDRVG
ncbi:ExeA family protein [Sphingomonas sp.]|uniref:ExeA family protein n=1 Tax=Sphingomonas sp. TaxID=28214 RepID=UPI002DD689FB|nr:AAA family ATPase [Sphingomonas sp.]